MESKSYLLFVSTLLILLTSANAWTDQVVTIYFCGTGIKSDAYLAANTTWGDPELLSTMYRDDDSVEIEQGPWVWYYGAWTPPHHKDGVTTPHNHHKYIVNGVGTSPGWSIVDIVLSILGSADPDLGPRSWHNVITEAQEALWEVYVNHPGEDYTVNLLGYSRGGVSALQMARVLSDDSNWPFVKKINILAYDPVPGGFDPIGRFGEDFVLSSKVKQYVGIYAEHERTYQFEPVIPHVPASNTETRVLLVRIPGSHETMAGNLQLDGHFMTLFQINSVEGIKVNTLRYVKDMARVFAEQLLKSDSWGDVPLKLDTTVQSAGVDSAVEFGNLAALVWSQDYSHMSYAFAPVWGTFDGPYSLLGRDHHLRILVPWSTEYHGRLAFVTPYRHEPEWAWPPPFYFPNAEQVYWLNDRVPRISADTWHTLQSFRNDDPLDATPPVPDLHPLPTIYGDCSVTITTPPTATDSVAGLIYGTTVDPLTYTAPGSYQIRWTYTDPSGNEAVQVQTVVVDDIGAPIPNEDELPTLTGDCLVELTEVPTASDCNGVVLGWTDDPLLYDEQGTYTITWIFDDGSGNVSEQTQTVIVSDLEAPAIDVLAQPDRLWPPNHRMVPVDLDVVATDNCDPSPYCRITDVQSSEAVSSVGGGDRSPDWVVTGDLTLDLRSERFGSGVGRIYTVELTCSDYAENQASELVVVHVPHDQSTRLIFYNGFEGGDSGHWSTTKF
jgi:hypothetical protein